MKAPLRFRLFWKLFLGFWFTFFLTLHGLWLLAQIIGTSRDTLNARYAERATPSQLGALAAVLQASGPDAVLQLLESWPAVDHARFRVVPATEHTRPGTVQDESTTTQTVVVPAPDGVLYAIVSTNPAVPARFRRRGLFDIPFEIVLIGAIGGLLFATVMAWYLTRPVRRLREGFERLAGGDLAVRLRGGMGRRRDEIADLARDFDAMAERLQKLIASKQQLLHEVSHELRSPLARIQVAVGLARLGPDRTPGSLDRIETETARLDAMIGELLTLARAEHHPPQFEGFVDLPQLLRSLAEDARFEAESCGVAVDLQLPTGNDPSVVVRGNAELIRRAIDNVVRNAIRHSGPGQRVILSLRIEENRRVVITTEDQGPGVPLDRLESIFEPFVRADGSTAAVGFGLGLAISKRTIEAHGGTIAAANRESGGLAVRISLPYDTADTEEPAGPLE